MFNRLLCFCALICCALFSLQALATTQPGKLTGGVPSIHPAWFKESFLDIAEDAEEAADSGKHVMLFMHLNNCPYCAKMVDENIANAPYTPFIKENFDVIQINIKGDREVAFDANTTVTEKELARLLKVRYTPTILFLNQDNKTVLRLNGYRSVPAFKHALDFVQQKAYLKTNLSRFIEQQQTTPVYTFRDHPLLKQVSDLQSVADKPLALLFEDSSCDACDALHDGHLKNPEIMKVLENYTFVRLDANSDEPIIDPAGNKTTPKAFAEQLGLTYRPGIVLFDQGREIERIDGLLFTYHFQEMLRYVGERHYVKYPKSFYDYLNVRTAEILESGQNIDLSK
ncbi:thioredoxin family protein [Sedimenticola thiotaurini]|uniref:thioredoxin family protein n=1 Tax=Sedimenticola thiotaurini TaxID=1543721 RepID=UPI00069C7421|nr:thioredoxin fold domain-containing protein [Sedimenticola thiotaurini]